MPFLCKAETDQRDRSNVNFPRRSFGDNRTNQREGMNRRRSSYGLPRQRVAHKSMISQPSNFQHLSSGAGVDRGDLTVQRLESIGQVLRDPWKRASVEYSPKQGRASWSPESRAFTGDKEREGYDGRNGVINNKKQLPPQPEVQTEKKVNAPAKRNPPPAVTPSVIRSVASPYDQRHLRKEEEPPLPRQPSTNSGMPVSLQHLYSPDQQRERKPAHSLGPSASMVDLMRKAIEVENYGLPPPAIPAKQENTGPSQSASLAPPATDAPGPTTLKYNAALAQLTEALKADK